MTEFGKREQRLYNECAAQLRSLEKRYDFSKITESYVKFLKSDKDLKKNSFLQWNIGGRGWGKTALAFDIFNIIMENNEKRKVQFFKAPKFLIENIYKRCPENLKGRIETIDKIRDIEIDSIFIIDEGLLGVNAKEALRIEMRRFSKFLSKSRHPNIIGIINSVNLNILSEYRDMIDIIVYKRLTETFIQNNYDRDKNLIRYKDIITKFKEWQGLMFSSYKRFEKIGLISIKYEDYCPWFSDKISRYQKKTSPDIEFDEQRKLYKELKNIAYMIIEEKRYDFYRRGGKDYLEGWLFDNFPDIYYDHKKHIGLLYKLYKYYIEKWTEKKKEKNLKIEYKEGEGFPEFAKRNTSLRLGENASLVAYDLLRGTSYRNINDNHKEFGYAFIQDTADFLRNKANVKTGFGYLFERWYALSIGVPITKLDEVLGGSSNKPDLLWNDKIYSIKLRFNKYAKSFTLKQSTDLGPEYRLALKKNSKYKLVFINPGWSLKLHIIEIDPHEDPEEIPVKKPQKPMKKLIM